MRERGEARELSAHLLRLTQSLYRVTDLMPRDEPLRRGIREKAGEIFSAGVAMTHGYGKEEKADEIGIGIEILLGYLSMARMLGCVNPMNFLVLEREYRRAAQILAVSAPAIIIEGETTAKQSGSKNEKESQEIVREQRMDVSYPVSERRQPDIGMNGRQKVILDCLAKSGQMKISDFYKTFNGISSKTIQRDLQDLAAKSLIRKAGDKRWTIYMLV